MPIGISSHLFLQGTDGPPVYVNDDNIIYLLGTDIIITGNSCAHTLTFSTKIGAIIFTADFGSAVPNANVLNLFGSAAQGLITSASGNTVTFSNLDWSTTQKGVGRLATPEEVLGGTATDVAITPGDLFYVFDTLDFYADDGTSASPENGILNLFGSAAQGLVTSASGNTVTFSNLDWSTIQKGVGRLATPEEVLGGTATDVAITPGDLFYVFDTLDFYADDGTSASPENGILNLFGSAAQGLVTSASGNTVTFSNLDWSTIQKGVGRLATPEEVLGGTATDVAITPGDLFYVFDTLDFYADDGTSASPENGILNLFGSAAQGLVTTASGNTVTFSNLDWSTTQKGVGRLATPEEVLGGTATDVAITPGDLFYVFDTLDFYADDGTSASPENGILNLFGSAAQGLVTSASGNTVTFSNLDWSTIQKGVGRLATPEEVLGGTATDVAITPGDLFYVFDTLDFYADDGTSASPENGILNLFGSAAQGLVTSASGNTVTFSNLDWSTIQKGVGRLATPEEVLGGTATDVAITPGDLFYVFDTLDFYADDGTSASPENGTLNLFGSAAQGLVTSASGNTVTFSNLDWSTIQKGVGRLATPEEVLGGTATDVAITPGDLFYVFDTLDFYADDGTSASPENGTLNLFGSAAQGLVTSASGNTVTFSNLDWSTIQKGVGRLATPEEVLGGTATDVAITPGDLFYVFDTLDFYADDGTSASPENGILNLFGSAAQGLVTSASGNTVTFSNFDWTTTGQKGVGRLANDTEATEGTLATVAITPSGLNTKLGTQTQYAVPYSMGSNQPLAWQELGDGQLLIGSAGNAPLANTLMPGPNILITNGAGAVTISASGTAFGALIKFKEDNGGSTTTGIDGTNLFFYLLGSLAQGLVTAPTVASGAIFYNVDWTTVQKGVGRLATVQEAQGGTVTDAALTPSDLFYLFNSLSFVANDQTTAVPLNGVLNLFGSVAQGLRTSGHGNTVTFCNLSWTTVQKGVGRLATAQEAQGGTVTNAALTPSTLFYLLNALDFIADGNTTAVPANGIINHFGSAAQGLVTTASGNTITFSNLSWTTVQKGVGRLATAQEAQGGTVTNAALTPSTLFYLLNALDFIADGNTTAVPANGIINHFGSAAQGLVTTASGNTVTFSNLSWTTVQKGVGRLATAQEAQGGTVTNAALTPSTLFYLLNALDFIADGNTTAVPANGIINHFGSAAQGLVTTASGNTITFSNLSWTTVQKGVGRLATAQEAQGGTVTNAALTPSTLFYLLNALDFIADGNTTAVPSNGILNLFGSAAQGLVTTASGNTITFSNLSWTTVQKGVGRLATAQEAQGGTVTNAALTPSTLFYLLNALDFIADGNTTAVPANGIINHFGSAAQGLVTTASGNTVTFSNLSWTTVQKGVGRLATAQEAQGGTVTNAALTPSTLFYLLNALDFIADGNTTAVPSNGILNLFGSAAQGLVTTASGNTVTFSNLSWTTVQKGVGRLATAQEAQGGTVTNAALTPSTLFYLLNALDFIADGNTTAVPSNGILNLFGSAAQGLVTTASGNTVTFSNLSWTTVQKGVGRLATAQEAQGGR